MYQVVKGLYRGPRPDPKELLKKKIKTVICLQSGLYDLVTGDEYDEFDFYKNDIDFVMIGMSDFLPPSEKDVKRALGTIINSLSRDRNVYIHCLSGVDRTGFVVAAYRMQVYEWSFERAYDEWIKMGRHWWYFYWTKALRKYEKPQRKKRY